MRRFSRHPLTLALSALAACSGAAPSPSPSLRLSARCSSFLTSAPKCSPSGPPRGSPRSTARKSGETPPSTPNAQESRPRRRRGEQRKGTPDAAARRPPAAAAAAVYAGRRRGTSNGGRTRTTTRARRELVLDALANINSDTRDACEGAYRAAREPHTESSAAATASAAATMPVPRDGLLARLNASNLVSRLQAAAVAMAAPMGGWWSRAPSSAALRHVERQLELVIRQHSLDAYAGMYDSLRARFEDPLQGQASASSAPLLLLYTRLLVNYGAYCLLNSDAPRAAALLQEAVATAQRASRSEAGGTDAYGVTAVLYTRVLLANALACDHLYWQAAEQYLEVMRVLEGNPYDFAATQSGPGGAALTQIAPGTHPYATLSRQLILEDVALFMSEPEMVDAAASQGRAQELLLRSQGAPPQVLSHLRLTLARLYRYGSVHCGSRRGRLPASRLRNSSGDGSEEQVAQRMAQESRLLYEVYLDDLVAREEDDRQYAMLELGRMLCETPTYGSMSDEDEVARQLEAGVVYLEAASELLMDEAEAALASPTRLAAEPHHPQLMVRAAAALVDTAQAHYLRENYAAALGLYEGSVDLLQRAGLSGISAWVLCRYADVLSSVSLVDKALTRYTAAMDILRRNEDAAAAAMEDLAGARAADGECDGPPLQLGPRQRQVSLTSADVEASLAYCYQAYVGNPRRALRHYEHVLDAILAAGGKAEDAGSDGMGGGRSSGRRRPTSPGRSPATVLASVVPMEREHFILTNMVACGERLQEWDSAIAAQKRLIALEAALGSHAVAACVRAVCLMENKGEYATMLGWLFYLMLLPDTEVDTVTRLTIVRHFAKCCYTLGNQSMGSILLNAVRRIEGDNNVSAVLDWALAASQLDASERLYAYAAADAKADVSTIASTFLRAAKILVAQRVCVAADAAAGAGRDGADAGSPPPLMDLEAERNSLITLSRGAFFFHQNGFSNHAEELYSAAIEIADAAQVPAASLSATIDDLEQLHDYNRELAIVLANYATLKYATDPARAEALYDRAASIRPAPLEVAEVVADFFVQSGNYVKGAAHIARVIEAHPGAAVDMHCRAARLGCSAVCDTLAAAQRLEVLEHAVLGLGVDPTRLPRYSQAAPTTEANLAERVAALDELALDGVRSTASDEAACLVCFLLQTKYPNRPRLVNLLYRVALRRFPFHTAMLVNYARLCGDLGFHALTRKLYARAYGAADGDFCRTLCYVNYLSSAHASRQVPAGEALYRHYLESNPAASQAHMLYANFIAMMMPTPFKAERHFARGLELDAKSPHVGLYAQFVWATAEDPVAFHDSVAHKELSDKAEALFKMAVAIEPESPKALLNLGTYYANRRNRFEDAVQTLYKAHTLAPTNAEVARQLCAVLLEECMRVQLEGQKGHGASSAGSTAYGESNTAALSKLSSSSGHSAGMLTPMAPRLRSLMESTQLIFDKCLELDPTHRGILEKYAGFAVTVLKNPTLAADLWIRINRLDPK